MRLAGSVLINNDVGSHGQDTQCGHQGEGGEEKQTQPVQNHRSEPPVSLDRVRDLVILDLVRDYFDLLVIYHDIRDIEHVPTLPSE